MLNFKKRTNVNATQSLDQLVQSKSDKLFLNPENRFVYLTDMITEETALDFTDRLLFAAATEDAPIIILINSGGGDAYSTCMIIDAIQSVDVPTIGLTMGLAGSGAFYAFQACDKRVVMNSSLLFWHEMIHCEETFVIKSTMEAEKFNKDYKKLNDHLLSFFKKKIGYTAEEWNKIFAGKNDLSFNSNEAIKNKLADKKIDKLSKLEIYFKEYEKSLGVK